MRTLALTLILASATVVVAAGDTGALNGKWQVRQNIAGNENSQVCTFTQNGNDLSGSCVSEQNTVQVSGKVNDKKVTWTYKVEYNGSPLTIQYAGTIDSPTKISGTVTVEEFSVDGEFTATQAQ